MDVPVFGAVPVFPWGTRASRKGAAGALGACQAPGPRAGRRGRVPGGCAVPFSEGRSFLKRVFRVRGCFRVSPSAPRPFRRPTRVLSGACPAFPSAPAAPFRATPAATRASPMGGSVFGAVPFLLSAHGFPRPAVPFLSSRGGCLSSRVGCLSSRVGFFVPRCLFFRPGSGVFRPCVPGGRSVLSLCVFGADAPRYPRKVLRGLIWHPLAGCVLSLCARSALPARCVRSGCGRCVPAVLRLCSGWSPGVFRLCSGCVPAGLRLCSDWSPGVFRLCSGCAPAVLRLCSGCPLRLCSGCVPAVVGLLPLCSRFFPGLLPLFCGFSCYVRKVCYLCPMDKQQWRKIIEFVIKVLQIILGVWLGSSIN